MRQHVPDIDVSRPVRGPPRASHGTATEAIWRVQQLQFDYYSRDGLVTSTSASISMAAPVEASDENVRIATTFKAHEILVARLRGTALPAATDIERFAASWQRISLRPLRLTRGDCDILDGLRRQVFPRLRIRAAMGFHCTVEPSRLAPNPRVEAPVRLQPARVRG